MLHQAGEKLIIGLSSHLKPRTSQVSKNIQKDKKLRVLIATP